MLDRSSILLLAALAALPMAVAGCATEEIPPYGDPAKVVGGSGPSSSAAGGSCMADPNCGVSFAMQVAPLLDGAPGRCTDAACHGAGVEPPQLTPNDPKKLREELLAITLPAGPYVACGDLPSSSLLCSIRTEMGVTKPPNCFPLMPKVDEDDAVADARLTQAQYDIIEEWILCGAPDN
ncbi:hypothetical protein [Polyangium spumosum]|uniref:Cytochrome C Planctomycete-type domain-containing protein n=1 Tax=Polyangium spumosum TaxID=889282 RepID=A0A6N7PMY9_9BACT|nr:hypothetical protein [Polyangium spumosum]MRG93522.1 hypothetical protein [Polyangium spumosum]